MKLTENDSSELQRFQRGLRSRGITPRIVREFRDMIYDHYHSSGRIFPWRETGDPYGILVSEIMLQQTQTGRVIPKYLIFTERFPDFRSLARASLRDVLESWSGLGYNRRAKALKDIAEMVVERFHGELPHSYDDLLTFPGIGPYTAGAVCAFAFDQPVVFMDTNIRRVFIHFFFPADDRENIRDRKTIKDSEIVPLVEATLDREDTREWYYALMDYGTMLKGSGGMSGKKNPNRRSAHYTRQSPFEGSDRQIRGAILRELLEGRGMEESELITMVGRETGGTERRQVTGVKEGVEGDPGKEGDRVRYILDQLEKEGFLREEKGRWSVSDD